MRNRVVAVIVVVVVAAVALWALLLRHPSHDVPASAKTQAPGAHDRARPERGQGEEQPAPGVLVDDDPKGALRLEGQVVDADDHPVGGATVVLGSNPPRTATTEADGGFAFDALVARPYLLIARARQGIAGPVTARLSEKSDPVVLHLRPGAQVTVTVVGGDGKPIEGATVELRGQDFQKQTTKAGKTTFEAVVPGGYQVAAFADGLARSMQFLEVGAGAHSVKLILMPGAAVSGRVIDDKGAGVPGARVTFHGASDWSQQASDRYDGVASGADGSFKLPALPSGSFRFAASHPKYAPGQTAMVTLDGKHEQTGVTITLAAGARVRGTVVDAQGKPVAGARVRIGRASRRGQIFEAPRQAYSDGDGVFVLEGLPRHELAAVAMHETGSSKSEEVDTTSGDVTNLKLVIDVTGTIAGVVVDPQGQPVEGVQVSAGPNFRDQRSAGDFQNFRLRGFPQELTDAAGKFTLTGLAPGSYSVTAMRAHAASRGRRGTTEGVVAETGAKDLRLVLQPEGGVKGRIALVDGTRPDAFTIQVGTTQQSFLGTDEFELDALAPQSYELQVRGPTFQTRAVQVLVEPGKTADVGTIQVEKGRQLAGMVVANGTPVPDATVYAGRQIFGNGSTNSANFGPMGQGTKTATTDANGMFSLAGFNDGDLAITAEHPAYGRSKALRIPTDMNGQSQLVLELQGFGALSGILRSNGKPVEGVFVSCQSTTTPGALYAVASGPDGTYRYDKLAPDTYKVSATVGMPMAGMKFYSKEVVVPSGQEVKVDLAVEPGSIEVDLLASPRSGKLGVASAWLASGVITAHTASELSLRMAAAGAGSSQWVIVRAGEAAKFTEITPATYTACVVPFPAEVQGMGAMGYVERHGDKLPAFCVPAVVNASPDHQTVTVPVDIPPFIPDQGSGAGSGSAH